MKKLIIIVPFTLIVLIVTGLYLINVFNTDKDIKNINKNDYSIKVPKNWTLKSVNDYESDCYIDGKKKAVITVINNCNYSSTTASIVTNLLGMHAIITGKEEMQKQGYKLTKANITYEQSAAEQIKHKSAPSAELHYFYTNNKNTLIDFAICDTELINQNNTDKIAESLIIK